MTKLEKEYQELKNTKFNSIKEKFSTLLAFDTSGRPGAVKIREHQDCLYRKIKAIGQRVHVERYSNGNAKSNRDYRSPQLRKREFEIKRKNIMDHELLELWDTWQGYPRKCGFNMDFDMCHISQLDFGKLAKVGDWWVAMEENVSWDNNCYSKSWHRAHGGKRVVDSRYLLIKRYNKRLKKVEDRTRFISGWRGNWLLNALIEAKIVKETTVKKELRAIQLHKAFTIKHLKKQGEYRFYERKLAGEHYDYCVLWHGLTYHAATIGACKDGLQSKIKEVQREKNAIINMKFCRNLGFCEEGIMQFCRDFDLDHKGSYSPAELKNIVLNKKKFAEPYLSELRKLADTVGISTELFLVV